MLQSLQHHHKPSRDHRAIPGHQPLRRQSPADAGRVPRLSGSRDPQHRHRHRDGDNALGHATTSAHGRASRHQHPVTNIRNTSSPHWRGWLKPENRCLVPANSFAEYAPEPNPETKKKDVVWFALNEDRPLFAFAGIWTTFNVIAAPSRSRYPARIRSMAFLLPRRTQW
jgi:putative SOS response-associated peptidase YedK